MELRLDHLLADLRNRPAEILSAIDADPYLLRRSSGELTLANASQLLYTPTQQHQLYAKGIVYTRDPYRLVSLPLIKIYNIGERDVTVGDLTGLLAEPGVGLRFLRKMDGSLVQVFRHRGQVIFTTRGMIEGASRRTGESTDEGSVEFDYLAEARRLAERLYPRLFTDPNLLEGRTLLFELIHPQARVVTNYGELADLFLLACFDQRRVAYVGYEELTQIAQVGELRPVDMLTPQGEDLAEQIENLLAGWSGTDEEGCVLTFERLGEVIYRVKVKSPEYLQLMRLMAYCTYDRTVELLDSHPEVKDWAALEALLRDQGRERVPEEVLGFYREHWERFQAYLADLEQLAQWAEAGRAAIDTELGGMAGKTAAEYRKAYASRAVGQRGRALLFAALDSNLDVARMRRMFPRPEEAREFLRALRGQ